MVLVYPDTAAVQAEIGTARAREAAARGSDGLQLVPGDGPSVLRQNVAMVESTSP